MPAVATGSRETDTQPRNALSNATGGFGNVAATFAPLAAISRSVGLPPAEGVGTAAVFERVAPRTSFARCIPTPVAENAERARIAATRAADSPATIDAVNSRDHRCRRRVPGRRRAAPRSRRGEIGGGAADVNRRRVCAYRGHAGGVGGAVRDRRRCDERAVHHDGEAVGGERDDRAEHALRRARRGRERRRWGGERGIVLLRRMAARSPVRAEPVGAATGAVDGRGVPATGAELGGAVNAALVGGTVGSPSIGVIRASEAGGPAGVARPSAALRCRARTYRRRRTRRARRGRARR